MKYLSLIIIAVLAGSCSGSADKKAPEMASDMCNCFTGFQSSLDEDSKQLLKTVAMSDNTLTDLQSGMLKLKPAVRDELARKLQSFEDPSSEVYQCMKKFDDRYSKETTRDRKGLIKKVLTDLRKRGTCYVGAIVANLSLEK